MQKRKRNGGDDSGQGRMELAVKVTGEEGQTDADATLCTLTVDKRFATKGHEHTLTLILPVFCIETPLAPSRDMCAVQG